MWTIKIPDWVPPSLNTSRGRHWKKGAANTNEVEQFARVYGRHVPKITDTYRPRREVCLDVVKAGKLPDPDNLLKHLLDGLKAAGLIVDDSATFCQWATPKLERVKGKTPGKGTLITIRDLPAFVQPEQTGGERLMLSALDMPELYTGDACEVLNSIRTGTAQLVFADPPFNIGYGYDEYNDSRERSEYLKWCAGWLYQCARILAPGGSMFLAIGDEYAAELKLMLSQSGLYFRNWIIWEYAFGTYCPRKFGRNHTHILYFTSDPKRFTFNAAAVLEPSARQVKYKDKRAVSAGRVPGDVWHFPRVCGTFNERTAHPCQMPEAVLERIVAVASNPGDVVFDPFAGSGTTLAVAKKLGRVPRGVELSASYGNDIRERLDAIAPTVRPDPDLFGY